MQQLYQDSMAIVHFFGKPDLFITVTANPNWPEIRDALLPGQSASDQPDLITRVFNLKLKAILEDLVKNGVLGKCVAHVYAIEFQKCGLPHAHMLIFLDHNCKFEEPDQVDLCISAEIPDPETHPMLYATVTSKMMHGPCGTSKLASIISFTY